MKNLKVVSNPLILRDITYLRNKETKEYQFEIVDLMENNQPKGTKVFISFPNDLH